MKVERGPIVHLHGMVEVDIEILKRHLLNVTWFRRCYECHMTWDGRKNVRQGELVQVGNTGKLCQIDGYCYLQVVVDGLRCTGSRVS